MKKKNFGVLRETKNPPDRRTAISPNEALLFMKKFPDVELFVQSSKLRAYTDKEYTDLGVKVVDDVSHCDILIGVKEVKTEKLLPEKTYIFFSHTAKKQPYNKGLLQEILDKKISLIDYEYLTNPEGQRLVAFGRWAGIIGAYNALVAYGIKSGNYNLKRAIDCYDMDEVYAELKKVKFPENYKVVITGGGRVAHGSMEILDALPMRKVSPQKFLERDFHEAVYTQVDPWHYTHRKDGTAFNLDHFINHPEEYASAFAPYTQVADMYISGHFWSDGSPLLISHEDMQKNGFNIKLIADISCDIAGPIASTVRASSIENPFYGYNIASQKEVAAFTNEDITVMAVDNLPGEAPRAASVDFSRDLIACVFPSLFGNDKDGIIERATIVKDGILTNHFDYLQDWADNKE